MDTFASTATSNPAGSEGTGFSWWWSLPLAPALGSALTLLAPWFYSGSRGRSTVELLGTAGALDVVEGPARLAAVLVWLLVPILVGAGFVAGAARRPRLAAWLVLPVGLLVGAAAPLVVWSVGGTAGWGAWAGGGLGLLTAIGAVVVLSSGPRDGSQPVGR